MGEAGDAGKRRRAAGNHFRGTQGREAGRAKGALPCCGTRAGGGNSMDETDSIIKRMSSISVCEPVMGEQYCRRPLLEP